MAPSIHTYGPTCRYSATAMFSAAKKEDDVPIVKAQFFYSSPLPIDDPLSAIPAVSATDANTTKYDPRPFSPYDNDALEETWLSLSSEKDRKNLRLLKDDPTERKKRSRSAKRVPQVKAIAARHIKKHSLGDKIFCTGQDQTDSSGGEKLNCPKCSALADGSTSESHSRPCTCPRNDPGQDSETKGVHPCCAELENECRAEHRKSFRCAYDQDKGRSDLAKFVSEVIDEIYHQTSPRNRVASQSRGESRGRSQDLPLIAQNVPPTADGHPLILSAGTSGDPDTGTTGTPFQRTPEKLSLPPSRSTTPIPTDAIGNDDHEDLDHRMGSTSSTRSCRPQNESTRQTHIRQCKARENKGEEANIPVGISRLHLVKLPELLMMPIYWSPVHDIASVSRATWFYKDTMYPVEATVANLLEQGYRDLRPWSQTWKDELNSAIEVGAAGEEKVSHRLWPKDREQTAPGESRTENSTIPGDPYCAARCFGGAVAATGILVSDQPDDKPHETPVATKRFQNSHVIYKDAQNAFILKPSLQPSEYYSRRPVSKIRRGAIIGLHVVRGFDWKLWSKLHPSKKSKAVRKAETIIPVAGTADAAERTMCLACDEQEDRPKVTDLVLVVHGIGQKLSERVESFHFTHAINAFRRSMNMELSNEAVQSVLRDDLGGIMVLPINWRSNLSLDPATNNFSLRDITPETLSAVRSVISEVVMDVPYYMSDHGAKMNEALTTEANRVYRLWCQNNPGFQQEGRVHIIAHSLGCAMTMDVLSKQPTSVGNVNLNSKKITNKRFEFDTKNLFFAGSPAGLFLLLRQGRLQPRRGRSKPGVDRADDNAQNLTGEAAFGCLAVDNLYNIVHQNDPIATCLNATVDSLYAASIKSATVPSTSTGWLETITSAVKSIAPGAIAPAPLAIGELPKPPVVRLPSQLEMEVHDFTREEIAEKLFYLLNDNGQIDYFLSPGGGALEIQYLNMLSAHSSYWYSPDFVRMLVIEVGRKPGRLNTLPNMRMIKKTAQK